MALAVVWVSSGYFPVLGSISYSTQEGFVFLARVRVSSEYFPVLDCISYTCARKRPWLSLWLGLAVDIFQFWNVYRTVSQERFRFFSLGLGLAVIIFQFWIVYHTIAQGRDRGSRCG